MLSDVLIAPSIHAADLLRLGEQLDAIETADYIQAPSQEEPKPQEEPVAIEQPQPEQEEVPEEVQKTAAAYEQTIVNSRRRMEIMHSMGVGVADWE